MLKKEDMGSGNKSKCELAGNLLELLGVIIIFSYFLLILLTKETTNLDELWNFNIARNIAKGLIPYKEISLITTPLLPILEAGILKVTANELIIFRILNAVLITTIIISTYKIFCELQIKKAISAIMLAPIIYILKDEVFLDYNFFVLFITLIITFMELKLLEREPNKRIEILIGALAGLAICTKQTIGILICVMVLILPLILKWSKKEIKIVLYRLVGTSIPVVILIIYLLITGAFYDFLSYTFLAINTFSNSIPYSNIINSNDMIIKCLAIILPVIVTVTAGLLILKKIKILNTSEENNTHQKKQNSTRSGLQCASYKRITVLLLYTIPLLLIQYPIADELHFKLSNYMTIILTVFIIYTIVKWIYNKISVKMTAGGCSSEDSIKDSYYKKNSHIKYAIKVATEFFVISCTLVFIVLGILKNTKLYKEANKNYELKYYNGLIVPEYIKTTYEKLNEKEKEYESQGKKVNILDSVAVAIHIPMDKYVKNFDMFNKGNFGKEGEEGLIKQIKESNNQVYLIKKREYKKNWQNPNLVTDYVENNLKKIDEVDIYDIYEK